MLLCEKLKLLGQLERKKLFLDHKDRWTSEDTAYNNKLQYQITSVKKDIYKGEGL